MEIEYRSSEAKRRSRAMEEVKMAREYRDPRLASVLKPSYMLSNNSEHPSNQSNVREKKLHN